MLFEAYFALGWCSEVRFVRGFCEISELVPAGRFPACFFGGRRKRRACQSVVYTYATESTKETGKEEFDSAVEEIVLVAGYCDLSWH